MVAGIAPITLDDCGVLADVEQREAVLVTQRSGRVLDQDRRPLRRDQAPRAGLMIGEPGEQPIAQLGGVLGFVGVGSSSSP
jgi:hypothetical protein